MPEHAWKKSANCASNGCVEVAFTENGDVLIRDSEDPDPVLRFTPAEWDAFIAGAKDGEFDF